MESNAEKTTTWTRFAVFGVLALAVIAKLVVKLETSHSAFAHNTQITFDSPAEAGGALAKAAETDNETALAEILGIDTKALGTRR